MILLYILLIVFILAVNFYSFLYLRNLHKAEQTPPKKEETSPSPNLETTPSEQKKVSKKTKGNFDWKLLLSGALGGAITIYVCMFIFKYKLNDLLLMVVMPVLAAANGYLWFVLFQSGFFIRM